MALNAKAIKTRIGSVKNTKKITKAMEMVAAAKMRKAVDATLQIRTYAELAKGLLDRVATVQGPEFELMEKRPVGKMLLVLISSNRGLCGSFNANVLKKAQALLDEKEKFAEHVLSEEETISPKESVELDVLGIGKKSALFAKRNKLNLIGVYDDIGDSPDFEDVISIADEIITQFKGGGYDKVKLVYTHFQSSLTQVSKMRQLLPVTDTTVGKMMDDLGEVAKEKVSNAEKVETLVPFDNAAQEPSPEAIIEYVIPRLVEIQLYQGLLESVASEHSARMVAMKSASDAASDMIDSLNLIYNKARQAAITQEIAEIAGGAAALE